MFSLSPYLKTFKKVIMAKFKHSKGEIDINKKHLATYNDEQLAQFGADNGMEPEDVVKLREKIGEAEVEETPETTKKTKKK